MKPMLMAGVLSIVVGAMPVTANEHRIPVADRGAIVLEVPSNWKKSIEYPAENLPPIIRFTGQEAAFTFLLTPVWSSKRDPAFNSLASIRALIERGAKGIALLPHQKAVEVKDFEKGGGKGYYFTAVDIAAKRGEHKYLTQGAIAVQDILLAFSIWTNERDSIIVKRAFEMLSATRRD